MGEKNFEGNIAQTCNVKWEGNTVTTAAGTITLRGGERALEFDGIPVVRDKDHPAGAISFMNSNVTRVMS